MKRKTTKEFKEQVLERYGNEYEVLGEYVSTHVPIKLKHNLCGNIWDTTAPYDFLKPHPNTCPECARPSRKKSNDDFKKELYDLVGNEYKALDEYVNKKTKIRFKHNSKKCNNHIFSITPNGFLSNGNRCPICRQIEKSSKGELEIEKELLKLNLNFKREFPINNKFTKRNDQRLKFDFFLEEYNIAIEFDGEQHFKAKRGGKEEFEKTKIRDSRKNEYCKENNIILLRIPYYDIKDIKQILIKFLEENNVL